MARGVPVGLDSPAGYEFHKTPPSAANGSCSLKRHQRENKLWFFSRTFLGRQERSEQQVAMMERRLAILWAEILNLEEVGVDDDFFALGGNSLLAASLVARIESQLGVKLPVTSILEAWTVARLARLVESGGSHAPLIVLRDGAERTPLFLVHDAEGETIIYRNLSHYLDPAQPVYGLKPLSALNHPILHTRIEEMAKFHIATMRGVQATGPYLLGGLCAGGLIGFEMARQLQAAGEKVAMVALLDAADVNAQEKSLRVAKERFARLSASLEQEKGHSFPRRVAGTGRKVLKKARNFTVYQIQSRVQRVRDKTRMTLFSTYLNLGLRMPAFLQGISVRTAYNFAKGKYRPATAFDGEMTLFRATSGTGNDEPYIARYVDPLLGWGRRASRGIRAFDVPGGHSSMLQEPNVRVLGEQLRAYIDAALKASNSESGESAISSTAPERTAEAEITRPSRPAQVLVVSASSREDLASCSARLADRLDELDDPALPDVSYSLAVDPPALAWRRAVVADSRTQAIDRLRKGTGKGVWSGSEPATLRPVAFVLAGVGEQAAGAGRGLYEGEPAFRAAVDGCAEILRPLVALDIRESMFTGSAEAGNWLRGGAGVLKETRIAQPAAFVLDWGLAQMWLSWGIKPAAVLGYSVGEYAAAALAGVLRLEDALLLVARRAQWIEEFAERGVMLAVPRPEAEVLPRLGDGLWVAAVNSPQATVVGGREESIRRLEEQLSADEIVTRRVASDQGSHTPLLDPVRPHLKRLAESVRRDAPQIPMLSNVTGSWLSASEAQDANHWCEHMCGSLRFQQGIGKLLENHEQVVLEVGPGAGLGAMVRQHPDFRREMMGRVLTSLPGAWDRLPDQEHVAGILGRLWVEGAFVDWQGYFAGEDRRPVELTPEPVGPASPQGADATTGTHAGSNPAVLRANESSSGTRTERSGFSGNGADAIGASHEKPSGHFAPPVIRDTIEVR
jgi:thioesterase domain-containing protein/malonyl CoA-acyl carrier protein transacylase/acyl carrier protein